MMPSPEQKAAERIVYTYLRNWDGRARQRVVPKVAAIIAEYFPRYDEMREALEELIDLGQSAHDIPANNIDNYNGQTLGRAVVWRRVYAIARGGLGDE
jgi:hypothetical protein